MRKILFLVLFLVTCDTKVQKREWVYLNEADNGQTIICFVGQKIKVTLETKFDIISSWQLANNDKAIKQKKDLTVENADGTITQIFEFEVIEKKEVSLVFVKFINPMVCKEFKVKLRIK